MAVNIELGTSQASQIGHRIFRSFVLRRVFLVSLGFEDRLAAGPCGLCCNRFNGLRPNFTE